MIEKPFLEDFTRTQWASAEARAIWEPRIAKIGAQFMAAERESVELGLRSAALQNITPEQLPELAKKAGARGMACTPLSVQGRASTYAASPVQPREGGPWDYRVLIAWPKVVGLFVAAWDSGDDDRIGELLGYPKCCRKFFLETWGASSVDPTWQMRDHGNGPREANILLRWLGVRYIPHMPCSFQCKASACLGGQIRELINPPERIWSDELLDSPMLWSSLNGIGEVITPVVSVNFRSDPGDGLRQIRREGSKYPEAGARGVKFPYRPPRAAEPERPDESWRWTDNGFSSRKDMLSAHRTILEVRPAESSRTVLDLGCGNGLLSRKLAGAGGKAIGVEVIPTRARRAETYLDEIMIGDLIDIDLSKWGLDLTLLMPGRILEAAEERGLDVSELSERFRGLAGELLVYAYGDWLEKYGSLEALCEAAGLAGELLEAKVSAGAEAGVWSWGR